MSSVVPRPGHIPLLLLILSLILSEIEATTFKLKPDFHINHLVVNLLLTCCDRVIIDLSSILWTCSYVVVRILQESVACNTSLGINRKVVVNIL